MCPFCYIGKRNFETALQKFPEAKNIEIVWKSFQLDPQIPSAATQTYAQYLTVRKGISPAQTKDMLDNVTKSAAAIGLDYRFDKAVMVNSGNAHRVIQLAKEKGLGNEAEERLFRAFFTDGADTGNPDVLAAIGREIGLTESDVRKALSDPKYGEKVAADIREAQQIGVNGVPFFVLDRKYAVSGAQAPEAFMETMQRAYGEWRKANPETKLEITQGAACTPQGKCD